MIKVTYKNDGILVELANISDVESNYPYTVNFRKHVSGEIQWSTKISDFSYATFPNIEMFDVEITDSRNIPVYTKRWDVMEHGTYFYKTMWMYCKSLISKGILPKGLVIGTHDGEFGEWVPCVLNKLSKVVLVEASQKQFEKLFENYHKNELVTFVNQLITPEGGEVEFFEGGEGYTNSVVESVIRHWETEEIQSTKRQSININTLINNHFQGGFDWLHLDVEGLDDKLIMGIEDQKMIPNLVIFEDYNLINERKTLIYEYFKNLGYKNHSEGGICMSIKLN